MRVTLILLSLLIHTVVLLPTNLTEAADWGYGADIGFLGGTVDETVLALSTNLDYYIDRDLSIGPIVQVAPNGNLMQIAGAMALKYRLHFHYSIPDCNWRLCSGNFKVVPFGGAGAIHADLSRDTVTGRIDRKDTSYYIPLGLGIEYEITPKLSFASTFMLNLHDLQLGDPIGRDRSHTALFFGFRLNP